MDINEARLRQARAQQASASSTSSVNSPTGSSTMSPWLGGDMNPNEVRLGLARTQQVSGSSSTGNTPQPNNAIASYGGVPMQQTQTQPAQHGSRSPLINTPPSPLSGYNANQASQSTQSGPSGQYFPAQDGHRPSGPNQIHQSLHTPQSSLPVQVGYRQTQYWKLAYIQRETQANLSRTSDPKPPKELHTLVHPHTDHPKHSR